MQRFPVFQSKIRMIVYGAWNSFSVQVDCTLETVLYGIRPFTPRDTAARPPDPATRKTAWLPLITASRVVVARSKE